MIEDVIYDKEAVKRDIRYKRLIERQISMDVCCKEIGISKPTLSRIEKGNTPDLLTFLRVVKWLEKDINEYVKF
jgi:transcriptional regulator with XRE-family HTH domain